MNGAVGPRDDRAWMRWVLAGLYGGIGIVHLSATETFLPIVPDWVPRPFLVVIVTGLCEIAGAIALFSARLRTLAGCLLAAYAVCVFPANVKQALEHIVVPPIPDTWWYHAPRLAFQPVMMWWALYAVHVVDWPFGSRRP